MKRFLVILALVALVALPASAQRIGPRHATINPVTKLDAVAMNGAASTRTFGFTKAKGFATMMVYVDFTHANNGALTLTCTWSPDDNATAFTPQTCSVSSGACTLNDAGTYATASLSADKKYAFPVGLRGADSIECVLDHGGTPAAGDIVTLKAALVTQ